jgi:hypothetical protein
MLKKLSALSNNKPSLFLLIAALIVCGVGAQATGILNTPSGGYLVCVNSSTKVVTHPGTSTCPKGSKRLVLGAQGEAGTDGLTGAAGLPGKDGTNGKDGNTIWNGVTDPASTLGVPGDMFINTVTKTFFGPKDLTNGWPAGVSMVGPAGPTGAQGPGGASGPAGATGPQGSNATLTCAQGGTCAIGDTGPGGGIVFIVQTPTAAAPWRYMEAAPNTWSGGSADPQVVFCNLTNGLVKSLEFGTSGDGTFWELGRGFSNTRAMLGTCTNGAANMAASYNGGGKSDWFLASKLEMEQLYSARVAVGGFMVGAEEKYWTSSENGRTTAFVLYMGSEELDVAMEAKGITSFVRPVRAF